MEGFSPNSLNNPLIWDIWESLELVPKEELLLRVEIFSEEAPPTLVALGKHLLLYSETSPFPDGKVLLPVEHPNCLPSIEVESEDRLGVPVTLSSLLCS